jgi:predicted enzyme related to lactoylglutathione lyase
MSISNILGGLLGVVFLLYNLWSFADHYRLKEAGATLQAQVTRCSIARRKGGISYNVEYAFDLAGKHYEGAGALSQHTFSRLSIGGPVPVRYVSINPTISEPAEMSHDRASLFLHGALGIPISLMIFFAAFRKEKKLSWEDSARPPAVEMTPRVRGIAFTMYPVTDMKRARKFYEEDLGLRVSTNFRGEWIEYHLRENCFAITSMLQGRVSPGADSGGSVAFEVCNLDKFVADLRQKGIRIQADPFETPVCRMAVLLDPEGNAFTLHERKA